MSMTFGEYVNVVADNISACAGSLPSVRDVIASTGEFLEDCELSLQHANWFWQMVAGELIRRRPAEQPRARLKHRRRGGHHNRVPDKRATGASAKFHAPFSHGCPAVSSLLPSPSTRPRPPAIIRPR